jgi:hypothetical protein
MDDRYLRGSGTGYGNLNAGCIYKSIREVYEYLIIPNC